MQRRLDDLKDFVLLGQMRASLQAMQASIGQWTDRTFPSHHDADGRPNPKGPIHHLADPKKGEAQELLRAFEAGEPIGNELADCAILLFAIAHLSGVPLYEAIVVKMNENIGRKWGPPDENGICLHIKEGAD